VINAAGLYCDEIAKMAGDCDFSMHPRKGQFYVIGKDTSVKVEHIIKSIPGESGHGILISPTVDGNLLVGPTAEDLEDKSDHKTTRSGLEYVKECAHRLVPELCFEDTITQFAGLRPAREPDGYHIRLSDRVEGYVEISGIRSTGLTSSLGIAKYTIRMMEQAGLPLRRKSDFCGRRKGIVSFADKTDEEKNTLIMGDSLYGRIICRCEQITESEIVQAIHRPVGARTVDAVKRRVRAGMGRCQGGFCSSLVIDILARELSIDPAEIRKRNGKSYMLYGKASAQSFEEQDAAKSHC
jgi:glycerol-3-phosphate dehydrogenase